ncbi:MAG: DNA polymerase [Chitinispirillaceae bacterium]|nr:DNA polymerase [Chitinispirillaceae bacterium]
MNGVKITDWEQYNDYRDLLGKIKDYNLLRIKNTCGIANPNSDSFKEKIYELYEYEPEITKTGELSLTEKMLENIIRRTGDLIVKELAISKMTILKIDRILNEGKRLYENLNEKTGRVHPIYNIIGTKTGRVVASNPPIQHISKESIFKFCPECNSALLDDSDKCCLCNNEYELNEFNWISAESGCSVIEADYSQMEIRILAELSKEMSLINIINQDIDIYKYIAGIFFNKKYNDVDEDMRNIAKQILISFVYGSTPIGVAQSLNIDVKRVETLFKKVKELFPRIEGYVYRVHKKAEIEKYVETPFGRRRRFNDIGFNELRQAQNFPIQSFAFDIVTYVAYNISNELKRNNCGRVIKLTPDSIIVEYPNQDYNLVKKILHYYMVIWAKKHFNLSVNLSIKYKDIYVENENKNLLKYGRLSI